eukprot:TRINITY_DN36635_c0_g1_i2.p1 TRINITY_DN36635_c0_g1~~TRINITY_DN36635_c0_g1_i2.p1  ORF type:complete len:227 (+),score=42.38 TRINITY_DN36635_c0_g1_i2:152-832(+)
MCIRDRHVLGGSANKGATVGLYPQPSQAFNGTCRNQTIVNNSDSSGPYVGNSPIIMAPGTFGMAGAEVCRELCCAEQDCQRFTYTDPQPGGSEHYCWLKGGAGQLLPGGCGKDGHCWSGELVHVEPASPAAPIRMEVNMANPYNLSGVVIDQNVVSVLLDIFVDGAVIEVFANDGERVLSAVQSEAEVDTIMVDVVGPAAGADVRVDLTAWSMRNAITSEHTTALW